MLFFFNLYLFSDKKIKSKKANYNYDICSYTYIFIWKAKNKIYKTVFSKRIKSEDVIISFTYLFVNIDTEITFASSSKPMVYIFSEFIEVSFCFHMFWGWISNMRTKVFKLLSPYLAVLWTFTCILFGLCVSHLVLWNISSMKAGSGLFRVLKTSNPNVPRCLLPLCTCLICQEEFCNCYKNHCTKF